MADNAYQVIQISEGQWRIEEGMVRSYLFEGAEKALLVDTGFGGGDIRAVVSGLTKKPVMVVNTHADGDHIGCNGQFDEIYMHPAEYAHYYKNDPNRPSPLPLQEGDVIDLGGRRFEVILIPGHTTGSIALLDREGRILVAGDSISKVPVFMFGPFRNFQAYIFSLKRLSAMGDLFDTIYPSHGPFPVEKDTIDKLIAAAHSFLRGEIPAQTPPYDIPAKMYVTDGVGFFANIE